MQKRLVNKSDRSLELKKRALIIKWAHTVKKIGKNQAYFAKFYLKRKRKLLKKLRQFKETTARKQRLQKRAQKETR